MGSFDRAESASNLIFLFHLSLLGYPGGGGSPGPRKNTEISVKRYDHPKNSKRFRLTVSELRAPPNSRADN